EGDVQSLRNYSLGAEQLAEKAAQALGYYQAEIDSEIKDGDPLRLVINIQPGEPVHLRNEVIRVEGPAASLKAFRLPT
ncbi:POTRA domain-containing protein, partial [Pseudomonas syringae group genomosp. 7]|uniref:POTRA domain-containing protein n=1 Tax=Pseudomonas syringae group genomosp. 7 TaxID=251699 RepID=UPI00376FC6B2